MKKLPRWFKVALYLTADLVAIVSLGLFIYFSRVSNGGETSVFIWLLLTYAVLLMVALFIGGIYSMITLYFGLIDSIKIGVITIVFNLIFYLFIMSTQIEYTPVELAFVFI